MPDSSITKPDTQTKTVLRRPVLLWSYAFLVVAAVLFAIATAYGFYKMRQGTVLAQYNSQAALWLVVSFEREYLKLDGMLWRYTSQDPDLKVDDLLTQYDILWSRIELMREGGHARPLRQVETYEATVPVALRLVEDHEARLFEAVSKGRPLPQPFVEAYRAMAEPIHRFMIDTHLNRGWIAEVRELQVKDTRFAMYLTLGGTIASTLLLFGIVLVQLRGRYSNLVQTMEALEQSEKDSRALRDEVQRRELVEQDRRALMVDLESRNEELERYAYTISHDLKSPLYTIQGFTGFLERGLDGEARKKVQNDLDKIREAVITMGSLLDDILKLSRLDKAKDEFQKVSMDEIIEKALSMLSIEIEESGIKLSVESDQPEVVAEPQHLAEVFQNLISNAVKFMGDQQQPVIEIGARSEGDWVHCHVRDNGSGIAPEYQERVFNLFERLETGIQGTGVGLAIVKRVIERHGGRVWILSDGEGQGCSFEFTLRAAH